MKLIAVIFILPLTFLMIQPVLNTHPSSDQMKCCTKMRCHKNNHQSNNEGKCENNTCNPFMPCIYGNFFTTDNNIYNFTIIKARKGKSLVVNDNRLSSHLSDCWHPPQSLFV